MDRSAWARLVADSVQDVFFVVDRDLARYAYLSEGVEQLLGIPREVIEEHPRRWVDALHPEDRARVVERLNAETTTFDEEFRVVRADGSTRWLRVRAVPLAGVEEGWVAGVLEDVTEQRRSEEALLHQSQRVRALLGQVPVIMWTTDRDLRITSSQGAGLADLGLEPDELVGVSLREFLGTDDPGERPVAAHLEALDGASSTYEMEFAGRWFGTRMEPLRSADGSVVGVVGVALDLSGQRQAELRAQELRERYELVAWASNDAVWDWDLVRGTVEWSDAVKALFGYAPDEVGPDPDWWIERIHPDDRDRVHSGIRSAVQGAGELWTDEYRFRRADRTYATVFDRGHISRDEDGRGVRMVGSMLDLSDRLELQEALTARLAQQEAVADLGLRAVRGADVGDLMTEACAVVARVLDVPHTKVLEHRPRDGSLLVVAGSGWAEGVVGETVVPPGSQAAYTVETGGPVVAERLRGETRFTPAEILMDHAVESGVTVVIWCGGRPYGVLGVHATEPRRFTDDDVAFVQAVANVLGEAIRREEMDAALRERERWFRRLTTSASDVAVVVNAEGLVTYVSPAVRPLFGYAPTDLVGSSGFDFAHPEDLEGAQEVLAECLERPGERIDLALRVRHGDGSWRWVDATATNLLDDPAVGGLVVNLRDVTEQRLEEERRKALERRFEVMDRLEGLGRVAGGVAHDFNNFLGAILNYTALALKRLPEEADARSDVEQIQRVSERATELTRRLLLLGRRGREAAGAFDLGGLVTETEPLLRSSLGSGITLEVDVHEGLPPVVGDPGAAEQALLNLGFNARDAMPEGGTVGIGVQAVDLGEEVVSRLGGLEPGAYVRLRVDDDGPGMAEDVLAHAFEPFYTTKARGSGTGLGLATVYGTLAQVGGCVDLRSEVGRGTTVDLYWPVAPASVDEDEPPADLPRGSGRRILLVDDVEGVRETTRRILVEAGYEVAVAADAETALERLRDPDVGVDLVVTDVVMPGKSGVDLAEHLEELRPGVPVLLISGYADEVDTGRHGPVLPKPFTEEALIRHVEERLGPA